MAVTAGPRTGPFWRARTHPEAHSPADEVTGRGAAHELAFRALQRETGNAAVQRLVAGPHERPKVEGDEDKERAKDAEAQRVPVDAVIQRAPMTRMNPALALAVQRAAAFSTTLTKPAPTRSNTASSTTHADNPTFTGHAVENTKRKCWTYALDTVEASGKIQIVYFTPDRYPAPTPEDDSGALTNVTSANVAAILKDFKDNRRGIPDHWSAYLAEDLHEQFHWDREWLRLARPAAKKAESKIGKLKVDKATAPTQSDAEKELEPKAKALFDAELRAARAKWNAMGDSAGDPPYRAQAPAVDALAARVKKLKKEKKW
ncbi:hypothetical protein [Occultella kanbiaonis]|uniref:hypothetical protein n=1 Tax=Occultella kanbiaonis TaxID=2675754 RepID=UPI0013D78CD8|nr:hypothetical protein [Occultella kanbiaonis]